MGTAGEGVFYTNKYQKKFTSVQVKLPSKKDDQRISVFPFFKRNDSILWIGTTNGTLKYNFNNKTFKQYETGKKGVTYCFAEDKNGTLWAGGIYDGLMKYNPKTDTFTQWLSDTTINSLSDSEVLIKAYINSQKKNGLKPTLKILLKAINSQTIGFLHLKKIKKVIYG